MLANAAAIAMALLLCAAPAAVHAQGVKLLRVGIFAGGGPGFDGGFSAFRARLRELGYEEGRTLALEVRNAEGRADRYAPLAAELARLGLDVIVVQGNAALAALNQATRTVPVVMANISDPVGAGFVTSLTRPGGNITGVSNMAEGVSAKWVELLREASPRVSSVAVLWDPKNVAHRSMWKEIADAGRTLGVATKALEFRGSDDLARAFSKIAAEKISATIILPHPAAGANLQQIVALTASHRVPAVYLSRDFPQAGGLMSYGPSLPDMWARAAEYVHLIAKGAKAGDLPVNQPTKFALVVNRKSAAALGLTLPPSLLLRAEEILY